MRVRLTQMRLEADRIVSLTLRSATAEPLPPWAPGAHVDLPTAPGRIRQYSLCGDPDDRDAYRVAVLHEPDGRGGSAFVHEQLRVGDVLELAGPRNHFALVDAAAYVLVAGGIGITPLLAMIRRLAAEGRDWQLFYGGRERASMAFLDELEAYGARVDVRPEAACGLLPVAEIVAGARRAGAALYCCGPGPLIDAVEAQCVAHDWVDHLHVERFAPSADAEAARSAPYRPVTLVLARSGETVLVPADRSLLDGLLDAGADVMFSCQEGTCGSCETRVLDGCPEHRDSVLSPAEREAGDRMLVCVSRAVGERLVLDL